MTSQLDTENPHGLTELANGVMDDAQEIIKQQFNLAKVELEHKASDIAWAASPLIAGILVLFVAITCLAFALAYGLASQGMPLWGGFTVVGGVLLIAAACLAWWSKALFKPVDPSPTQTVEGLKENMQWKTTTAKR
jgi:putative superfamily III holin-X